MVINYFESFAFLLKTKYFRVCNTLLSSLLELSIWKGGLTEKIAMESS